VCVCAHHAAWEVVDDVGVGGLLRDVDEFRAKRGGLIEALGVGHGRQKACAESRQRASVRWQHMLCVRRCARMHLCCQGGPHHHRHRARSRHCSCVRTCATWAHSTAVCLHLQSHAGVHAPPLPGPTGT